MSEFQKLQTIPQERQGLAWRQLLKSPRVPYVLLVIAMGAYVVIVWQWF